MIILLAIIAAWFWFCMVKATDEFNPAIALFLLLWFFPLCLLGFVMTLLAQAIFKLTGAELEVYYPWEQ